MGLPAKTSEGQIARPLRVLVPLIQDDLKHGREEAERAGLPHFRAAGEKMLEAKPQLAHGEFQQWIKRHFAISYSHAARYMQLAAYAANEKSLARDFSSLSDFVRQTSSPTYNRVSPLTEQVNKIISRVDTETLNLKREELKRADERVAQRELALQLIDIGYRVLARKLHPDRGGSRDAMARLNTVRNRLKETA